VDRIVVAPIAAVVVVVVVVVVERWEMRWGSAFFLLGR
jgi:hypothetical protein